MTRRRWALGSVAALIYVLTVVAANYAIDHWGTSPKFPSAPHTIPVGFGRTAPSGVMFVALALVTRDYVQWTLGRDRRKAASPTVVAVMAGLILVGAGLSYVIASTSVATASALAFLSSEALDFGLFTWVAPRWARAVLAGGLVGAVADSLIFLYVAFGSLTYVGGQILGKSEGIAVAAVLIALRRRAVATPDPVLA